MISWDIFKKHLRIICVPFKPERLYPNFNIDSILHWESLKPLQSKRILSKRASFWAQSLMKHSQNVIWKGVKFGDQENSLKYWIWGIIPS